MTKENSTKKSLLSSVVALFMCVMMLIGTTFAWFTDTASTAVNKIQAGNLKVKIVDADGTEIGENDELTWQTAGTNTTILWEPGCTYNLKQFKIQNAGDLAIKYKVVLKASNITEKDGKSLLDVIDWTIKLGDKTLTVSADDIKTKLGTDGVSIIIDEILAPETTSDAITVSGHMQESAGNEYQGLSIDGFGVTVYATQASYEYDSSDKTYDLNAEYSSDAPYTPAHLTVSTAAELQTALSGKVTSDEAVITLANDIQLKDGETWTPLNMESYGQTIHKITINGGNHTITGLNAPLVGKAYFGNTTIEINDLTLKDCTMVDNNGESGYCGAFVRYADNAKSVILNNCHLTGTSSITASKYAGGLVGYGTGNVTLKDCSVEGATITGESAGGLIGMLANTNNSSDNAEIKNCTVKNCTLTSSKSGTYRVGEIIGTATVAKVTLSGITTSENTLTQSNATGIESNMTSSKWIGRYSSTVTGDTSDKVTL